MQRKTTDEPTDEFIGVLELLEWQERAVLTLKAIEGFNSRQIGYCLAMSTPSAWVLSRRTHRAVCKLLESKTTRWDTPESFYRSFEKSIEEEIGGDSL
jgi:DNA-directed RNA polymerase specialized sigma24 family protein